MNYVTVSFLNLFCYVLWGAARYMGHPQLMHVALLAALASLYFTVRMLLYYLHHKADTPPIIRRKPSNPVPTVPDPTPAGQKKAIGINKNRMPVV